MALKLTTTMYHHVNILNDETLGVEIVNVKNVDVKIQNHGTYHTFTLLSTKGESISTSR